MASDDVRNVVSGSDLKGVRYFEADLNGSKYQKVFNQLFPKERNIAAVYSCYSQVMAVFNVMEEKPTSRKAFYDAMMSLESVTTLDKTLPVVSREVQYKLNANEVNLSS